MSILNRLAKARSTCGEPDCPRTSTVDSSDSYPCAACESMDEGIDPHDVAGGTYVEVAKGWWKKGADILGIAAAPQPAKVLFPDRGPYFLPGTLQALGGNVGVRGATALLRRGVEITPAVFMGVSGRAPQPGARYVADDLRRGVFVVTPNPRREGEWTVPAYVRLDESQQGALLHLVPLPAPPALPVADLAAAVDELTSSVLRLPASPREEHLARLLREAFRLDALQAP